MIENRPPICSFESVLDYLILVLDIPSALQDRLSAWLFARSCLGLETQEEAEICRLRVYFESEKWNSILAEELRSHFPEARLQGETAIRLPEAGTETPVVRELSLAGEDFRLLAGPAFGSGAHATTRIAADLLRRARARGSRVLDVGTGTGILALLASRFGAVQVDAVEISPEARENARANFKLNAEPSISLFSELSEVRGTYDLVLANMLTPTLLHLGRDMLRLLHPRGSWLVSGVTREERNRLVDRFADRARVELEISEAEWLGLRFSLHPCSLKSPNESES